MTLLDASLVFSAIVLLAAFGFLSLRPLLQSSGRWASAYGFWIAVSVIVSACSGSSAVFLQTTVLACILLFCKAARSRIKVGVSTVAATMAVYGAFLGIAAIEDRHYEQWRQEHAFQSLEDRVPSLKKSGERPSLASMQEIELANLSDALDESAGGRRRALYSLHQDMMERFVNAPGFGVRRMVHIAPTKERLMIVKEVTIPQPAPMGNVPTALANDGKIAVAEKDLKTLHLTSQVDFLNPRGWGWVKSRTEAAGFQSHLFRAVPKSERWQVRTIELVGLLLHKEPIVYVTANLPRMEELRKASTRALDGFEEAGLKKLQQGEALVVDQAPKGLRVLGAIRATSQCAECHGGDGGELLGAFAYVLAPMEGTP